MARIISLTILVTLIAVLGVTFFQVVAPFLLPLFLAAVVAILAQPFYRRLVHLTRNRPRLAAGLTTATVLLLFLIPLLIGTSIAAVQLLTLGQKTLGSPEWRTKVRAIREQLAIDHIAAQILPYVTDVDVVIDQPGNAPGTTSATPQDAPASSNVDPQLKSTANGETANSAATQGESPPLSDGTPVVQEHRKRVDDLQAQIEEHIRNALKNVSQRTMGIAEAAAGAVPGFVGSLLSGLIGVVMFVIALYYFLADGPVLISAAEKLIPVGIDHQRELVRKFDDVVRAIVLATFSASLCQGVLTATALNILGFGHFFVFFILATLTSMIPLVGTWMVWGPFAIWLAYNGQWGSFLFLAASGTFIIGTIDNIIRVYILHSDAKLHPLLAFVSVLGGLRVMGLWGVFVGPIVASCLHGLVKIFNAELKEFSKLKFGDAMNAGDDPDAELVVKAHITDSANDGQSPAVAVVPGDADGGKPNAGSGGKRITGPPAKASKQSARRKR